jgi:hypothetical protein
MLIKIGGTMEKVFFVKNGDLGDVNYWLQKGGRVKSISTVAESISAYGYPACDGWESAKCGSFVGDIFAYIVLEFD